MQPAVGPAKYITGIVMGAQTQNSHEKPCVLVVLDVSVCDTRSTRSSFMDLSNSLHMLDEINVVDNEATYLRTSIKIGLKDAFSNATSSCLNDERWRESITLLTDTATIAKQF